MQRIALVMAVLAAAGSGQGGATPVPAMSGSNLPNLYVSSIVHNGSSATITVCNNGTASAGSSRTFVSHWAGLDHEGFDIHHGTINAGSCDPRTVFVNWGQSGVTHSYNVYADDYMEVSESNENDNHLSKVY